MKVSIGSVAILSAIRRIDANTAATFVAVVAVTLTPVIEGGVNNPSVRNRDW
jgi:hypothetical protein